MFLRFCPLCGVLIELQEISLEEIIADPTRRLTWLQELRLVYPRRDGHYITGVGWLLSDEDVLAPNDYQCHYRNLEPQQDPLDHFKRYLIGFFQDDGNDRFRYAVHNGCWELLRSRVDPDHRLPVDTLASHLYTLLYNTPVDTARQTLAPGHDYGHAAEFQLREGASRNDYLNGLRTSKYFYITGDVTEKFEPDEEILDHDMASLRPRCDTHLTDHTESGRFRRLPPEIIMLLLANLPSSDVCQLRLASRYIADLSSSPKLLDQRFWSSRFHPDLEMGFVFAGSSNPRPTEPADWRMLYFQVKTALKSDFNHGLTNRRRIWRILGHMSKSLRIRLENEQWIRSGNPVLYDGKPVAEKAVFADLSFDNNRTLMVSSCRFFERQTIFWPREQDASPKVLRVSSVFSNGRTYISGFRFSSLESSDDVESLRAGFINRHEEQEIIIEPYTHIDYLDVAMAIKGLVGLRFTLRGPGGQYSVPVGEMDLTDSASGISRLMLGDNMQCIGLQVALDACKIISISLIEQQVDASFDHVNTSLGPVLSQNVHPAQIWNPNVPKVLPAWKSVSLPRLIKQPTHYFNSCLNMDFGGPGGKLLQSLVSVDALMGNFPSVFLGLSFIYSDGSERIYGRKSFRTFGRYSGITQVIRQRFLIDGPRGEVMTKITTSWTWELGLFTILSITITTNSGREKQFCLYGTGSEGLSKDNEVIQVYEAEPGCQLTAFYAKIMPSLGYFQSFTTHSEVLGYPQHHSFTEFPNVSHDIPVTPDILLSTEEVLSHPRGFALTAANLSKLKRIRVSVDDEYSPSSQGHISGLQLEYYDSTTPVILGQWLKELDALELHPDDHVTEITTWHNYINQDRGAQLGPVRKFKLVTVRGVAKTFLDPDVSGNVCLQYRENLYENLDGILWGLNFKWDHVRVLYAPKRVTNGTSMLLVDSGNYSLASWMVIQKVFLRGELDDGYSNPVSTIVVTFRRLCVSGITMVYKDRNLSTLGIKGEKPQAIHLSPGEHLAQVEIVSEPLSRQIVCIGFLTTSGQRVDCLTTLNPRRTYKRTVLILDPSGSRQETIYGPRPFPQGARSFVGFWAVPRQDETLRYGRFGAVFEREEDLGQEYQSGIHSPVSD